MGQMKLAFEVGQSDVDIEHGHVGRTVSEQFHHRGKAYAGTQHLRGIGVPELMGNDLGWQTRGETDLMQVVAKLPYHGSLREWARQQQAIGGQRVQRAEEAKANGLSTGL